MKKLLLSQLMLIVNLYIVNAAEFQWFKVREFEGWVEMTGTSDKRINVLPFVCPPGSMYWLDDPYGWSQICPDTKAEYCGIDFSSDDKIKFGFKIISDPSYVPSDLRSEICKQLKLLPNSLVSHTVSFVKITNIQINLIIGERIFEQKSYPGLTNTGLIDYFYLDMSNDKILNKIKSNDFKIIMNYDFPYSTFSSVNIAIEQSIITNTWISTFKCIVNQIDKIGGSFGPFDWSHTLQRTYAQEYVKSNSSNSIFSNTSIVMRDPTPEQLIRFNTVLGKMNINKEESMTLHLNAYNNAVNSGKINLADVHKDYLTYLENGESVFSKVFIEKLKQLAADEIMDFYSSGIKVNLSSGSSYFRYNGDLSHYTSTTLKSEYSEYIITNSKFNYNYQYTPTNTYNFVDVLNFGYEYLNYRVFNEKWYYKITTDKWGQGLKTAIENNDSISINYCFNSIFKNIVNPNYRLEDGNTFLHLAVNKKLEYVVIFLLKHGVNPELTNRHAETPKEIAESLNLQTIADVLSIYQGMKGSIIISIKNPGLNIISVVPKYPSGATSNEKIPFEIIKNDKDSLILKITDYPFEHYVDINLKYRITLVNTNYYKMKFQHNIVSSDMNYTTIEGKILLTNFYKIKNKKTIPYNEEIIFCGYDIGFIQNFPYIICNQ